MVKDGKIVEEKSVKAAVMAGTVTGEKADGLKIDDHQHLFNGVMVTGGKYAIKDADLSFVGNGGNDFQGYGAGVMTTGDADVTMDNSRIHVEGAIRSAVWCGGESHLHVKDTVIDSSTRIPLTRISEPVRSHDENRALRAWSFRQLSCHQCAGRRTGHL